MGICLHHGIPNFDLPSSTTAASLEIFLPGKTSSSVVSGDFPKWQKLLFWRIDVKSNYNNKKSILVYTFTVWPQRKSTRQGEMIQTLKCRSFMVVTKYICLFTSAQTYCNTTDTVNASEVLCIHIPVLISIPCFMVWYCAADATLFLQTILTTYKWLVWFTGLVFVWEQNLLWLKVDVFLSAMVRTQSYFYTKLQDDIFELVSRSACCHSFTLWHFLDLSS